MRVLLADCFAFECRGDGLGSRHQGGVDHIGCRSWTAIASVDQLDGAGCCRKPDQSQFEQPPGVMHRNRGKSVGTQVPHALNANDQMDAGNENIGADAGQAGRSRALT